MIAADIWIPQMVGYAALVNDEALLRRAWLEHDTSETSVTDYDELYEQIFDDLDADNLEAEMLRLLDPTRAGAIRRFLAAIRGGNRVIESDNRYVDMGTLLASDVWRAVRQAARDVVGAFQARPWTGQH